MASDWELFKFGDLYSIPSRNGLTKPKRVRGEGLKFINMGEIFKFDRMKNIPTDRVPVTEKEFESSELKANDLLFARQSLVLSGAGKCSIFLGDDEPIVFESHLIRVRLDTRKAFPGFLYYFFLSPQGRAEIWTITEQGAGQAGIRGSDLATINVPIPSFSEQKAIADILGSLDDKIELNRQMNETLEAMAQALFKSWFVDFDPVIDNALAAGNAIPDEFFERAEQRKGIEKKDNADIQSLFPDEFEFTEEMGWIPKGWGSGMLADICFFGKGKINTSELSLENYVSTENMNKEKAGISYAASIASTSQVPKFSVGQTLISNIRPYFKKIWLASFSGGRSNDVLGFQAIDGVANEYLFSLLYQDSFFDYMTATSKGTKMPRGDKAAIMSWSVAIPPLILMEEFSNKVKPMYLANNLRSLQSVSLAQLRDTLLPKLMSGELRIPDADAMTKDV